MANFVTKLIICPLVVIFTDYFSDELNYPNIYTALVIGLLLAAAGYIIELFILRRGTFWISTALDFISATLIVFFSRYFIGNSMITLAGALITALILCMVEILVHYYLIRSRNAGKNLQ